MAKLMSHSEKNETPKMEAASHGKQFLAKALNDKKKGLGKEKDGKFKGFKK